MRAFTLSRDTNVDDDDAIRKSCQNECWRKSEDSVVTSPTTTTTETESLSEDEGNFGLSWLGGIATDIRTLAVGVASFVQSSALAMASEITQMEEEEMAQKRSYEHRYDENVTLRLPWEVLHDNEQEYRVDPVLEKKIRALSTKEETFLRPYSERDVSSSSALRPPFMLDEPRIHLVRRMLSLDVDLAKMHARLPGRLAKMHARLPGRIDIKEDAFWQNYFYNCEMEREEHLMLSSSPPPPQQQTDASIVGTVESFEEAATTDEAESGSFVEIPSPPASQKSIGSMVVVNEVAHLELPDL